MKKIPIFLGACTAIVTPFSQRALDYERLEKQLQAQIEGGVSAVVVCGTTGENATLSQDEHNGLVRKAVNLCRGKLKVSVGGGGNKTEQALR